MNWYTLLKFAALDINLLKRFNVPEQNIDLILSFLRSIDEKTVGKYIAALRENPNLTVEQLKKLGIKEEKYIPNDEAKNLLNSINNYYNEDFYNWAKKQLFNSKGKNLKLLKDKINHIYDWMSQINASGEEYIDINGYDLNRAIIASDKWTKENQAVEGGIYEPTKAENIEMKYPDGFTMQRITSKIDTKVEGAKMDHCVGGYCEDVENEKINVYSLRDQKNEPRVTIGTIHDGTTINQLKGHSDEDPVEYKTYIEQWLKLHPEIRYYENEGYAEGYSGLKNLYEGIKEEDRPLFIGIFHRRLLNTDLGKLNSKIPRFLSEIAYEEMSSGNFPKEWSEIANKAFMEEDYMPNFAKKWAEDLISSGKAPKEWYNKVNKRAEDAYTVPEFSQSYMTRLLESGKAPKILYDRINENMKKCAMIDWSDSYVKNIFNGDQNKIPEEWKEGVYNYIQKNNFVPNYATNYIYKLFSSDNIPNKIISKMVENIEDYYTLPEWADSWGKSQIKKKNPYIIEAIDRRIRDKGTFPDFADDYSKEILSSPNIPEIWIDRIISSEGQYINRRLENWIQERINNNDLPEKIKDAVYKCFEEKGHVWKLSSIHRWIQREFEKDELPKKLEQAMYVYIENNNKIPSFSYEYLRKKFDKNEVNKILANFVSDHIYQWGYPPEESRNWAKKVLDSGQAPKEWIDSIYRRIWHYIKSTLQDDLSWARDWLIANYKENQLPEQIAKQVKEIFKL